MIMTEIAGETIPTNRTNRFKTVLAVALPDFWMYSGTSLNIELTVPKLLKMDAMASVELIRASISTISE